MIKRKYVGTMMGVALALSSGIAAAVPPSTTQVRELMQVFGVNRMLSQMNSQMTGVMQQQLPCVPASYWQNFVDTQGMKELSDQMIPVYQRHFSAEDVAGLLKFYRSPLGQKVIKEMPATMTEAMQVGRAWGLQRGKVMMAQLQKEGKVTQAGQCAAAGATQPRLAPGSSR